MDPGKNITVPLDWQEFILWISEVVEDMDWLGIESSSKAFFITAILRVKCLKYLWKCWKKAKKKKNKKILINLFLILFVLHVFLIHQSIKDR